MSWKRGKEQRQKYRRVVDLGENHWGVRQGGEGTYDAEEIAQRRKREAARAEESVVRIATLISGIWFQPGGGVSVRVVSMINETEIFSPEDMEGVDLRVALTSEFADFSGLQVLGIQAKSSETGVEQFANTGKKKFGSTGEEWKRQCRILLNGQWTDGSIVADFLVQLMNLIGVYGDEEEMADFMACLDETSRTTFLRNRLQVEQYRCRLLEWVVGKPHLEQGGTVFFYD